MKKISKGISDHTLLIIGLIILGVILAILFYGSIKTLISDALLKSFNG